MTKDEALLIITDHWFDISKNATLPKTVFGEAVMYLVSDYLQDTKSTLLQKRNVLSDRVAEHEKGMLR